MSDIHLTSAPVLSTPDTHIFEDPSPQISPLPKLSDEQLYVTYEIRRTVNEIREGRWRRIALQFPDEMLPDAPRVYKELGRRLREERKGPRRNRSENGLGDSVDELEKDIGNLNVQDQQDGAEEKLYILGDTSYGACCVDEIAAEHVDADVVVHYGRSCLSPTARLPVIYVYTTRRFSISDAVEAFKAAYSDPSAKVVLMADLPYQAHLPDFLTALEGAGYSQVYSTSVIHNPSSPLPNRSLPPSITEVTLNLNTYNLFHIGAPPPALLLTLHSRLSTIHIYDATASPPTATPSSSSLALRRRYALLTRLSTASIIGILINTLSVRNYTHIVSHVQSLISAAGKKPYTFVVGKINAAKIANFAEVEGWVVVGCWESSLVEGTEFFRPVVTPFELEIALKGDGERVWDGRWRGDWEGMIGGGKELTVVTQGRDGSGDGEEEVDEEESAPPEFDLRTGRYVSHSRPMRITNVGRLSAAGDGQASDTTSLIKRANGDLAQVGGVVSPAAEFLRSGRTWQGLGSDFDISNREGALVEEGRSGVARGYTVGEEEAKH